MAPIEVPSSPEVTSLACLPSRGSSTNIDVEVSSTDTLIPPSPVNTVEIPLPMSPGNDSSASPSPPDTLCHLTGTTLSTASSYTNGQAQRHRHRGDMTPSQHPFAGVKTGNSSQSSLGSRGSRFSERFDLDGVAMFNEIAVLAAEERTRQDKVARLRKKRRGVMVGDDEVLISIIEKTGGEEQEGAMTGCTSMKAQGIRGVKNLNIRMKQLSERIRTKARKVFGKEPKEGIARNF